MYGNFSIANIAMDDGAGILAVSRKRFFDTAIHFRAVINLHRVDGVSGENISIDLREVIYALHCSAPRRARQILELYQAPIAKVGRAKVAIYIP